MGTREGDEVLRLLYHELCLMGYVCLRFMVDVAGPGKGDYSNDDYHCIRGLQYDVVNTHNH